MASDAEAAGAAGPRPYRAPLRRLPREPPFCGQEEEGGAKEGGGGEDPGEAEVESGLETSLLSLSMAPGAFLREEEVPPAPDAYSSAYRPPYAPVEARPPAGVAAADTCVHAVCCCG